MDLKTTNVLPTETVAHIQSAGCKAQEKSVIGAHNRCWKYLIGAISTHGEATRDLEFIGGDKDRQIKQLWTETGPMRMCCDIFAAARLWRGRLLTSGRLSSRHPVVVCAGRGVKVAVAGRSVAWACSGRSSAICVRVFSSVSHL